MCSSCASWCSAVASPGSVPKARTFRSATRRRAAGGDARVSDEQLAKGSLWWLTLLTDEGAAPITTLLARSHPHGRWVQWLDAGLNAPRR